MASIGPLLVFSAVIVVVTSNQWICADYYWRDYYGVIPSDAIPAGKDHNGKPLYIGIVYIQGFEQLPATIYPQTKLARTTAYAKIFNTDKFVKILCGPHKEAFEWVSIESKDLSKYKNRRPIPGGSEVGEDLYIGRVSRHNDVIVGKVFRHERVNGNGIWFAVDNTITQSLSYDLLLYNCDKVKPKIDARNQDSEEQSNLYYY